ncbi:MAG: lipid-A-disaccharide synthase [Bacteroidia bacterium]|nr:lipid-A-disaccharide synthase [Bacteroidia bacterium]
MKYFLIAGEPSGDQHGSMLMQAILKIDSDAEFRYLGGDLMERVGGITVIHIRNLAFMGFTQLIIKALKIRENFRICKREIVAFEPHVVIPIDYGGFNLRLIRWLKTNKFTTVYYITPKVWAWMPSRAYKLARYSDRSMCILPFEAEFLKKYGVPCEYVGNPVRDYILPVRNSDPQMIRSALGLNTKPVIALLPGSRRQEISKILPVMVQVVDQFKDYQFVIAGHGNFTEAFYLDISGKADVRIIHGKTLELLRISTAALVTSGTATLETALLGIPQVVCYKTATVSYLIARMMVKVKYISLVNLILGKACIDELIQNKYTAVNLKNSLARILSSTGLSQEIYDGYRELNEKLGEREASATAAAIVCRLALEA